MQRAARLRAVAASLALTAAAAALTGACGSAPPFDARGPARTEPLGGAPATVRVAVARGVVLVPTWIDGAGPFSFVLDTGSTTLVVSERTAERAHLAVQRRSGAVVTEAGTSDGTMRQTQVRELRIGRARYRRIGALVADLDGIGAGVAHRVDGILGAPLLARQLWTVDLAGGPLRIEEGALPPADGSTILDLSMAGGLPTLRAEVAGRPVAAIVDTGQRISVSLGPSDAAALAASLRVVGASVGQVLDGEVRRDVAQLDGDVRFGSIVLRAPQVLLGRTTRLGTSAFQGGVLTFDLANRRMRVDPPADP